MTQDDAELYRQLKAVPEPTGPSSQEIMQAAAEADFNRRVEASTRAQAVSEPVHDALRSAFLGMPPVRDALAVWQQPERRQPTPLPPASPKGGFSIRRGSIHLVEAPPFITMQGETTLGSGYVDLGPAPDGRVEVTSEGGWAGSGTYMGWAAVGSSIVVPAGITVAQFQVQCLYTWRCQWYSHLFRLAAGNVWIGQTIIQRDSGGAFLGTPVDYQNVLYQYNDYNFNDNNDLSGSATGYTLLSAASVSAGQTLECFLKVGSFGQGDRTAESGKSEGWSEMFADITSLFIDLF